MDFSKSQMPEKSFQVTSRRRVTWRDFSGMSDLEKSILALPTHRIDIPAKKTLMEVKSLHQSQLKHKINGTIGFNTYYVFRIRKCR